MRESESNTRRTSEALAGALAAELLDAQEQMAQMRLHSQQVAREAFREQECVMEQQARMAYERGFETGRIAAYEEAREPIAVSSAACSSLRDAGSDRLRAIQSSVWGRPRRLRPYRRMQLL